jgi:uncharacterized small protein (DUF1192 family)
MDFEDLDPTESTDYTVGADLSELSVDELNDLITLLKDEIGRIEQNMKEKEAQRSAAASVFKA